VADELGRLHGEIGREDAFWPAQLAILAAIGLYLLLPGRLTLGPPWLLPIPEGLLLAGLVLARPSASDPRGQTHRRLSLFLLGLTAVATLIALVLLAHYLLAGGATGSSLLGAGVVVWGTLVLLSAVAYWELDAGGPGRRGPRADFLFAQMTDDARQHVPDRWSPGFPDYLYLALTNATAFSPTDTMPLTSRAKLVMGVQAVASLATLGLVVARAVNILS
jgi:uncharacterized membrane protein